MNKPIMSLVDEILDKVSELKEMLDKPVFKLPDNFAGTEDEIKDEARRLTSERD